MADITELQRLMMANYGEAGKKIGLETLMADRDYQKNFLGTQETIEELVARLTGAKLPEGIMAKFAPYNDSRYQEQDVGSGSWGW